MFTPSVSYFLIFLVLIQWTGVKIGLEKSEIINMVNLFYAYMQFFISGAVFNESNCKHFGCHSPSDANLVPPTKALFGSLDSQTALLRG